MSERQSRRVRQAYRLAARKQLEEGELMSSLTLAALFRSRRQWPSWRVTLASAIPFLIPALVKLGLCVAFITRRTR